MARGAISTLEFRCRAAADGTMRVRNLMKELEASRRVIRGRICSLRRVCDEELSVLSFSRQ